MSVATAVKERPILFSGPMVRAILKGRKTQTRRIIKPQPEATEDAGLYRWANRAAVYKSSVESGESPSVARGYQAFGDITLSTVLRHCPYGRPGECLWVRETFRETYDVDQTAVMDYRAGGTRLIVGNSIQHGSHRCLSALAPWRPSIFMPRWASRITLEITEVRVQRLHEISEEDAIAEGAQCAGCPAALTNYGAFGRLWQQINGADSWDSNPWVWAITFKRIEVTQ